MKKIILASGSPRRRELMQQIGLRFEVITSDAEEKYISREPKEIVKELALMKAENVAAEIETLDVIVIGADTVVVRDGRIMGKPRDEAEAFAMLSRLQGREHQVYTGVAILNFDPEGRRILVNHAVETKVHVHSMDTEEIREYISTGDPMDKAGAYGIQGQFAAYIDRIEGDYYNVVGLPVSWVYQELKRQTRQEKA